MFSFIILSLPNVNIASTRKLTSVLENFSIWWDYFNLVMQPVSLVFICIMGLNCYYERKKQHRDGGFHFCFCITTDSPVQHARANILTWGSVYYKLDTLPPWLCSNSIYVFIPEYKKRITYSLLLIQTVSHNMSTTK